MAKEGTSRKTGLWRLLKHNVSARQIAGYAVANLVGLAIVVCALRFYADVRSTFSDEDSFLSKDFIVISKKVSTLNTLGIGSGTAFSADEIKRLERRDWVRRVGAFTAAPFNVQASLNFGDRGMSTFLFLESIPDEFLDVSPSFWHFDAAHPEVPVIISKDYLTLYNFGFASSRGLPQLSESLIGRVPLMLTLSGNGETRTLPARIVGFSSRLNTIAVPSEFMDWASERFGPPQLPDPSRLIVEVKNPGDPAVERFMERNGYEIAGDKADNSRASYFLNLVTGVVVAIGVIISALAFFILTLSIFLLLQKNRTTLHNLMLLGYSPAQVARPYFMLTGCVNAGVLVLSLAAMEIAHSWWAPRLAEINIGGGPGWPAVVTGTAIIAVVTAANFVSIYRTLRRSFYES